MKRYSPRQYQTACSAIDGGSFGMASATANGALTGVSGSMF